jgi:glycerol uptake facilitator-like aquaporin
METTQFFAEIVGTFIFLLVIIDLVFRKDTDPVAASGSIPLYIGLGLCISIYVTLGLGGFAHLNPVVSAVCSANGNITTGEMALLIIAQFIGGFLAYAVWSIMGRKGVL